MIVSLQEMLDRLGEEVCAEIFLRGGVDLDSISSSNVLINTEEISTISISREMDDDSPSCVEFIMTNGTVCVCFLECNEPGRIEALIRLTTDQC